MGAQLSKAPGNAETVAEKAGEAAASPNKTNGQVNEILTGVWVEAAGCGGRGMDAQSVRKCGETDRKGHFFGEIALSVQQFDIINVQMCLSRIKIALILTKKLWFEGSP